MRTIILAVKNDPTAPVLFHKMKGQLEITAVLLEEKEAMSIFLKRRIKKLGLFTVLSQILFKILIVPMIGKKSSAYISELKKKYNFEESEIPSRLCTEITSINEERCLEEIKKHQPELILVNGTRILSKKLLSSIHCPIFNIHAGITPMYRGVHGGYWARVQRDGAHCGVTVHLIDPGIDTGGILYQANIELSSRDNFMSYPVHQLAVGISLLERAVNDAKKNSLQIIPAPPGESKLWYHPGFFEYLRNGLSKKVW